MAVRGVLLLCIFGYACAGVTEKPEAAAAEEVKCDTGLAHYIELGCKPIYSKVNEKCVERYDCPFVKQFEDPKKCYYKNKEYNLRQKIDESVNDHKCSAECSCRSNYGENKDWSTFVCAQVECPENFGPPEPSKAACIRQYKMDSCCSVNEICDAAEIKALATCNWDSKDYKEGQLFYPDNTCLKCICSKEYDGTLNDSWCQRINCGIELYSADSIRSKCAPVYLQSRDCCPIDWKCLDEDDKIEQTATTKSTNPDMKCQYGNETMDIGDTVKGKDECVSCVCSVPPMITCTRSLNC